MQKRTLIVAFIFMIVMAFADVLAGPLPDTGQTGDYTSTFGEDSDYTINPPSYTKLGQNGVELPDTATYADGWVMTRDNVTGLIWEMKTDDRSIHDKDNMYTWYDPNPATNGGYAGTPGDGTDTKDFIDALHSANFGGFSDWRMPTRKELQSIVHYGTYSPAIDSTYFPNTVASFYWSSTTIAYGSHFAWGMNFYGGYDYYGNKSYSYYVRAVRGGQSGSFDDSIISGRMVDNGDGTVTDISTGLMWQQQDDNITRAWTVAIGYCESSTLAGYDDWRLPNIMELDSIVDLSRYNPAIDSAHFPNTNGSFYWSSTTIAYNSGYAWGMDFGDGYGGDDYGNKSYSYYVRAVRGGQSRLLGHLVISAPQQGAIWPIGSTQTITWEPQGIAGNVSITLSRDGGKTFPETLSSSTPNDGSFQWAVSGLSSVNCVLKIIPIGDPGMATSQGLLSIGFPPNRRIMKGMPWLNLLLE